MMRDESLHINPLEALIILLSSIIREAVDDRSSTLDPVLYLLQAAPRWPAQIKAAPTRKEKNRKQKVERAEEEV